MKYSDVKQQIDVSEVASRIKADPAAAVASAEALYHEMVADVARTAVERDSNVILLCGPSASGKTTSAHLIAQDLTDLGKSVRIISLDNFYKPHDQLPLWPNGTLNFESVDGIDAEYLSQLLEQLWQAGSAIFPIFDFETQNRSAEGQEITWNHSTYLIFEGIHALNPRICDALGGHCPLKVYVSVHSDFVLDGRELLDARDLRLTRRLLRDYAHRDSSVSRTLELWGDVLRGEELYMRPHRGNADIHINTVHDYEPFLYTSDISRLLAGAGDCGDFRYVINRIVNSQSCFFPISWDLVPGDSLINEFH